MDGESSLEPSTTFLCGVFLRPSERARELRDSSRSGSAARGRSMCLLPKDHLALEVYGRRTSEVLQASRRSTDCLQASRLVVTELRTP
jgi:hypothetical protein